jgi:PAS domain S-box-containing protein
MLKDNVMQSSMEGVCIEEKELSESVKEFQTLFDLMPDPVVIVDRKGTFLAVNRKAEEITGFKREELLGRNFLWTGIVTARSKATLMKNLAKRMMGMQLAPYEVEALTRDGEKIPAEVNAVRIEYEGKPAALVIFRELRERKKAEEALRESEERYRNIFELSPDSIVTVDTQGVITSCNATATKMLGYCKDEMIGKHFSKIGILGTEDLPYYTALFNSFLRGEAEKPAELTFYRKDGTPLLCDVRLSLLKEGSKTIGIQAISRDITERKKAEEELIRLSSAVKMSTDGIVVSDINGKIIEVNEAILEMYGAENQEDLIGKSSFDFLEPQDRERAFAGMKEVLTKGYNKNVEYRVITKDRNKINVEISTTLRKDTEGKPTGFVGIVHDITERKRFEERLSALNAYSRNLNMAASMEKIYQLTLDAMEKTLGFEHASFMVVDQNMLSVVDQRGYQSLSIELPLDESKGITVKTATTGQSLLVPDTRKENEYVEGMPSIRSELAVPVKIANKVLGVLNVESKTLNAFDKRDEKLLEILASHSATAISNLEYAKNLKKLVRKKTKELRQAQKQLLRAERMAGIGETAAMVGHDLRNPLQVMANILYLANKSLAALPTEGKRLVEKHHIEELMATVGEQLEYMSKIVSDLQDYARPIEPSFVETNLYQLIQDTLSTMTIPQNVGVSITKEDKFPLLIVDPALMKRVFSNLITNALQAMPDGGRLTIGLSKQEKRGLVSIQDTGLGIAPKNRNKIFQPLFTTKARGQGFGLPVCKKLVEAHDGSIHVRSGVGQGSTFTVEIPLKRRLN